MVIEKINIKSFGRLTDTTLAFSDSLNVIEGENEAGKSTIAAFIKYMLYGFGPAPSDGRLDERKKRINWNTGIAEGSMTVRVRDKHYLITRSTVPVAGGARPTYKEESTILDLETGTPAFGKSPAGEVFFGVNREFFENTAFLGDFSDPRVDGANVKENIENILFSGNEKISISRAAAKINDKMETLYHKNGTGGVIFDLMQKEEALEEALRKSNENNRSILAKEAELHEIRARKSAAEEKLASLTELDTCYKNVMLIQTFDQLHELEKDYEKKSEAYNAFIEENTKNHYVPNAQYLTDIAVARRAVSDSYRVLTEATARYTEKKNAVGITNEIESAIELSDSLGKEDAVRKEAKETRQRFWIGLGGGILALLVVLATIVVEAVATGGLAGTLARIAFGILGVGAVAGGVYAGLYARKNEVGLLALAKKFATGSYTDLLDKIEFIAEARNKRDTLFRDRSDAEAAVTAAKEAYEKAKKELTSVILRWGGEPPVGDPNEFLDMLESRVTAFLERKNALAEDKNITEITVKEIRRTLADKSEIDIRATISPLRRKALAGINHDGIISDITECRRKIKEEDLLAFDVENELAALKLNARDPGELISQISALCDRIDELKMRHKAYFVASETIASAEKELREEISPRLGKYATRLVDIMTDKKYTDLAVSDGMDVTFATPDGERRSADFLSGGTLDLTYVALRMALVDMLYTEKPPLTLDESFAHQDNVRAKALMKALKHLADEGQQSFVFTCRNRESTLASEMDKTASIFRLSVGSASHTA